MPQIVHSDLAPTDAVRYSLGQESFVLGGESDSYETDSRAVVANAEAHPWLRVEYPQAAEVDAAEPVDTLAPADDALSAESSVAFDPDAVREVEDAKRVVAEDRTAINAGLDQDEPIESGGFDLTLAADAADDTDEEHAD